MAGISPTTLTPGSTVHQLVRNSPRFLEPKGSFLCSHQPDICHILSNTDSVHASQVYYFNPLKPELNPICYLLALLAHNFLHVSRIRVKSLSIRLLMSYIYMEHLFLMFLDHTQRRTTVGRTPLDE